MFVAKPFIGFMQFNRQHPPAKINMFALQKAFSKRIIQYRDGGLNAMASVQKHLANPRLQLRVTFLSLLLLLFGFPPIFGSYFLSYFKAYRELHPLPAYLLNRQLIV
ncbi:hypothetical protein HYN43_021620 [Mucilaginibacter celer]|uniref:Uncharacterized protein n=2 Tax=Mucilaginibacter celer TaxID=2305508 RepID=A0A494W344_9SPHI|nr:hypothetical protein HYN43_021620 [Mucilaginibacter celer]